MKHYLFLTYRMALGYGVDVAVSNITGNLMRLGHRVTIGCLEKDGHHSGLDVRLLDPDPTSIMRLIEEVGCDCVIAHTTPFFEVLPLLDPAIPRWALEYGDPTPEFFPLDGAERRRIKETKIRDCYPTINGVIAISHFIRADIRWPAALVIHIGCNHVPDLGPKGVLDFDLDPSARLNVGTLMRLGQGESNYKGNQLFCEIAEKSMEQGIPARFYVMGRGTPEDATFFESKGIETHLNAPDDQKCDYLRNLDVFISPSLWEGFNLPLVEAQALGTVGVAFDTGSHPEVTPFVVSSTDEVITLLRRMTLDRTLLYRHSLLSYRFVRSRFSWEKCAVEFLRITDGDCKHVDKLSVAAPLRSRFMNPSSRVGKFFAALRIGGWKYAMAQLAGYLARRIYRP